ICNTVGMLAAGNTVVFSPHPRARHLSAWLVDVLNRAMVEAGAPDNLITVITEPTPDTTKALNTHPHITIHVPTAPTQIHNNLKS
ncbi:aldehyde dehydrogenase family protein, partial [Salmonella enterica subsp. enterica serovar Enteritidis]|nr:aldehyde dehydrogenase family protein [Salmonella enterica subsp. enterica serovar Enteritidis]